MQNADTVLAVLQSLESRMLGNRHVRFGGRPRGKGPTYQWAPRRAAHPAQAGKGLAGMDEHQVRRWTSWRRWTLLAMIAHALLAVLAANEHTDRPAPADLIELTCAEIRRLFIALIVEPARVLVCPLHWSTWRRRHQHRARTSHYQRQQASEPWP